jgi:sugar/nucleoside kinase (ribokinase family)
VTPDLVVLGNLLVDDVVFPDGRTRFAQPGGACLYLALGAALWGVKVGVASVRGDEYPRETLATLEARGIDLAGVRALDGPGLRTWLLYEGARRHVVHRLEGPSHAEISPTPADLPRDWLAARAFHLAPMPLEVQAALALGLRRPGALVCLDPFVLVTAESLPRLRLLLERIDVLFLSEDELELGEGSRRDALATLVGPRLRRVAFKRGERGGILYDADQERYTEWGPRLSSLVDPTGAGDAFAAGVLAGWLRGESVEGALARGVVTASFAIEAWGADGLLGTTPAAAAERLSQWFGD